jgi:lipid A ethanolaminephosphotransferase
MRLKRPSLHTETLVLLAAAWLLLGCNGPFWTAALAGRDWGSPGTIALAGSMLVSFTAAYAGFTLLFATRWTVRPLLSVLLVVAASLLYYMDRYAVFFDRTMLRNVLATNWAEARELIGPGYALHMLAFGIVPAALVWWPRIAVRPLRRALLVRALWIVSAFVLTVVALLPVFADFESLMRNRKEVRHLLNPGNAIAASLSEAFGRRGRPAKLEPVGTDARLAAPAQARPKLFVLVVGETARAQNFSLNGYARPTNPELAARDVINFPQVRSCGTSTEVSLPCMFSAIGRRDYDEDRILSHESLLHVLNRAGVQVLWRDNQSGCKGVCAGLPIQQMAESLDPQLCARGQCVDEALLSGLDQVAAGAKGSLFIVLHQLGSHGPAYDKRYPDRFRRFVPSCAQEELRRCSQQEIVNAYDNTILYTDHVLGKLVDWLRAQEQRFDTAMLYVSDHGESLGESGLYLHGVPFAIAPDVQTRVPMVMWVSPSYARGARLDLGCLKSRANEPASHDNLFHTALGAMDVQTKAYEAPLDLLRPCRGQ